MKPKVYKRAAMAVMLIALYGNIYAQAPVAPVPPTAPATPQLTSTYYKAIPSVAYAPLPVTNGYTDLPVNQNDTAYRKKMQKLQEKMHELQKEISNLRVDELKKNGVELSKRLELKNKVFADAFKNFDKDFSVKFDKNFTESFKNFGQNMRFNFDGADAAWDKQVQAGDTKLKTKTYSKSYAADDNDKLLIDNRFGKVTVNTWNKKEFKVDVEIKAYANDDAETQKLLDQVNIKDSKENSVVSFTTIIGNSGSKNSIWGNWSNHGKTIINYTVYMPAKSALTVTNRYGNTVLPDLYVKITINNSYGSLKAKSLTNTGNVINVKYGSADIENLIGSDLDVTYGSLNLQSADKLNANVSYGSAKIGKVNTSGTINVKYGGLQINDLGKSLKTLSVNSSFSPVKLSSLANTNADFNVSVHMGGFSYDDIINVVSQTPAENSRGWSSTKTYKGHIGKGNSDNMVVIKASYGSVKFDQ